MRFEEVERTHRIPSSAGQRRLPGEAGIWVFVFADMAVFAIFFGTTVYERGRNTEEFGLGARHLNLALGTVNTALLLCGSLAVALGVTHLQSGAVNRAPRLYRVGLACGLGFIAIKAVEWTHLLRTGHSPANTGFYQYYFVFTGIHLFHVIIGCTVLAWMIKAAKIPPASDHRLVISECGGIFWHMVDLLWVVLFALFYLVSR